MVAVSRASDDKTRDFPERGVALLPSIENARVKGRLA